MSNSTNNTRKNQDSEDQAPPPDNAATLQHLWDRCCHLAERGRILDAAAEALARRGIVGEERALKLIYLVLTSRLLDVPVSAVVKGASSAGKSTLVRKVRELFPPDSYHALTGMSECAIAYTDADLRHRILIIEEAAGLKGGKMAYLVRSLVSEGRIRYETVESTSDEGLRPRVIEKEGPTALLLTTTAVQLEPELETRMLSIQLDDSTEQTVRVMMACARAAAGDAESEPSAGSDLDDWIALQEWIAANSHSVVIPFARALAGRMNAKALRLRRDFPSILQLIKAHALLHQASREPDEIGRLVATLDDYMVIRELVADVVAEAIDATVDPFVRETVEVVEAIIAEKTGRDGGEVRLASVFGSEYASASIVEIARFLGVDKSVASRRVKKAVDLEYLINDELRQGRPAKIRLNEPLPDDIVVLPIYSEVV